MTLAADDVVADLVDRADKAVGNLGSYLDKCERENARYLETEDEDNPEELPFGEEESRATAVKKVAQLVVDQLASSTLVSEAVAEQLDERLKEVEADIEDLGADKAEADESIEVDFPG